MKLRLSSRVIDALIDHATEGYEMPYKREVGGHLLGFREEDGFYVGRAVPYPTRLSRRTWWGPNKTLFRRKGYKLETRDLKWVGIYHSHNEVGGVASTLLSPDDKRAIRFFGRPVEIVIRICNFAKNAPKNCIQYEDDYYYYDICGYLWDSSDRIRKIKVVEAR